MPFLPTRTDPPPPPRSTRAGPCRGATGHRDARHVMPIGLAPPALQRFRFGARICASRSWRQFPWLWRRAAPGTRRVVRSVCAGGAKAASGNQNTVGRRWSPRTGLAPPHTLRFLSADPTRLARMLDGNTLLTMRCAWAQGLCMQQNRKKKPRKRSQSGERSNNPYSFDLSRCAAAQHTSARAQCAFREGAAG